MSAPSTPNDGKSNSSSQPEAKKMKMKSNEKSDDNLASSARSSVSKQELMYTESDASLEAFEDEIAAEAYREEQELVFHVFSKTTTNSTGGGPTFSPMESNSKTSSNISSFDDTQSLRVDPVTGHPGRVFPNLVDDTNLVPDKETTFSLRSKYITGHPSSSVSPMSHDGQPSLAKTNAPSLKTSKSVPSRTLSKDVLLLYCGLVNEDGQSSHVNAVLQLLYSWKPIPLYVRSNKDDVPSSVSPSLHRSLDTLFQTMAGSVKGDSDREVGGAGVKQAAKVVDTKQFQSDFRIAAARFGAFSASVQEKHSAVNFLVAILQTLHCEVNKTHSGNPANSQQAGSITSAETAWEHKLDTEDDSFLVHLIKGQLQSAVVCLSCGGKNSLTWSTFWTLTLPLPPPEALKNELTLSDCLQHYQAVQPLNPTENALAKCSKCPSSKQSVGKQVTVTRAPQFLLIHLDLDAKQTNDSRPVLIDQLVKVGGREYSLLSAIVRQDGGHYVTLHGLLPQKWVLFDDQSVSVIPSGLTEQNVATAANCNASVTAQSMMRKHAYLLLYKFIH